MQLSYNSVSCHHNLPPIGFPANDDGVIVTGYSGHRSGLPQPRHIPSGKPYFSTKANGASSTRKSVAGNTTLAASAIRRTSPSQWTETHQNNLQRKLMHRLEVAKSRGDRHLVAMLEQEMKQLALI